MIELFLVSLVILFFISLYIARLLLKKGIRKCIARLLFAGMNGLGIAGICECMNAFFPPAVHFSVLVYVFLVMFFTVVYYYGSFGRNKGGDIFSWFDTKR